MRQQNSLDTGMLFVSEYPKKLSVLIVSADQEHVSEIVRALKKLEVTSIETADNGIEALNVLTEKRFGLLFCDQDTRYIKGWLLVKEIKNAENIPNLPVVLFGRQPAPDSEENFKKYGVLQYVQFPVSSGELDFVIHSTLSIFHTSGTLENKYTLAKDSLIEHDSEDAIERFTELQVFTDKSTRSSVGLAQAYVQDQQVERANDIIEEMVSQGKADSPSGFLLQIKIYLRNQQIEKAVKSIEDLLASGVDLFYHSKVVKLLMEFSQYEAASPICIRALRMELDRPEFYVCLSKFAYIEGRFQEALIQVRKHEKLFGMTNELYNLRGVCHKKIGDFEKALDAYEQALRLNPTDAKVYFNLAMCSLNMKRHEEAVVYLENCLRYAPEFVKAKDKLDEIRRVRGTAV